jgi:hypothetical protein
MRTFKIMCLALVAVVGIAGTGAGLYSVGYELGYSEVAYASPTEEQVLLAQADIDAGAGAGPAAAAVGAEPTQPSILRAPGAPCIDPDGLEGPKPCVTSPLDQPSAALDTVKAARKLGWPVLGGAVLFFLLVIAGKWVPYLREGKRALYLSGATAVIAAGVNAGFLGGDVLAMVFAAGGMLIALVQGDRTLAALQRQAKGGG